MAVIADEEYRAAFGQVDLHPDQTIRVSWQVVQRNALAEVEAALVECLPVPVDVYRQQVLKRQIDAVEGATRTTTYKSNLR